MKLSRFVPFLLVAGAPLLLVAACGGSQSERGLETEAGNEAGPDVIVGENDATTTPEVGTDAGPDGTMDVMGADSGSDSTTNENDGPSAEAGPDATMMMETGTTDTGSDSTTETGTVQDTGAEVGVEAAVDAGPDATIMDAASEAMPDASADAPADSMGTVDAGSDAAADTGGGGQSEGGSDAGEAGCTLTAADDAGGALQWAENFGTTGFTYPAGVAIDPTSGAIAVTGYFNSTANFGGGQLSAVGDSSNSTAVFVAEFDSIGGYTWAKAFGNSLGPSGNNIAIDGSGHVILAGYLVGTLDFGCGTLSAVGVDDIFLVSFDAGGTCVWSKSFGVSGQSQNIDSLVLDGSGNVLIAGVAYGGLSFGGSPLTGYFISKFASTGAYTWSNAFSASSTESSPTLAVDPFGNMILAGSFASTVNFGGGVLTSAGSTDAFVAKFDSSGVYQWAKQYGDNAEQDASGVAVDGCGNIFVTGNFSGSVNFGTGSLTAVANEPNAFLAKIDSSGTGVWADHFAGSSGSVSDALYTGPVAVDAAGGPTIGISLVGSASFGSGTLTSVGSTSAAIASFDPTGTYRWAHAGGSPSTANESDVATPQGVAANGTTVAVAGAFGISGTTLVLDGKTLTAVSGQDLFLASFAP
jgi:hypothetical protein